MNSNIITTSRHWNINSYERNQILDKTEKAEFNVEQYRRRLLKNRAPDTSIEDDSKRDKVK
jgi:hypothetical protein